MSALPAATDAHPLSPPFNAAAFAALAERLEQVLDGETRALERNERPDLAATCQSKRQSLLELSRFLPRVASSHDRAAIRTRLDGLAGRLERNRRALDVQLSAVREVAEVVARALREAESDGTYSAQASRR